MKEKNDDKYKAALAKFARAKAALQGMSQFNSAIAIAEAEIGGTLFKKSNVGLKKGNIGSRLLTQLRNLSIPSASTTGLMTLPFVAPAALAYANRPRTLAEKKVMQDYGMLDETFGLAEDYNRVDADRKKARGIGEEISFTDALLMDPETGKYPRLFGRTEDRDPETGLTSKDVTDDSFAEARIKMTDTPNYEAVDFTSIAEDVIPNKKDDDAPKEKTFDSIYEEEKSKLEKLLGDDDDRGMAAIALSEAIGTPGTIADKAAVLNKSLLGIMQGKKKDRKDIAKLAYTATKEIEKAKIAAGKEGFSEKQFNRMRELKRIIGDTTGTYNEAQKKAAQGELDITTEVIKTIGGKKDQGLSAVDSKLLENLDTLATKLSRIKDKDSDSYRKAYNQYLRARQVVLKNPNLRDIVALASRS